MRKIWMLALAPIRKNKGQAIGLFAFVLITAMLLSIGLALSSGIDSFFDVRAKENNAAHFTGIYISDSHSVSQGQRFMENDSRVAEIEKINAVGGFGEIEMNDTRILMGLLLCRSDHEQKMESPSFIGDHIPLTGNRIYVPYEVMINGKLNISDTFKMFISGSELDFTIAGATEEITFGTIMGTAYRFYISDEKYNELQDRFTENGLTLLSARFHDSEDALRFKIDYDKTVSSDGLLFLTSTYDSVKAMRLQTPAMIAVIFVAFAIVLLIVSLIVIRFRIVSGIEENMQNIGAQKAVGYRNRQIVMANVIQYGLTALIGALAGVTATAVFFPVIAKLFETQIALVWNPGFDISSSVISVLLVLAAVALITFTTSRRINKLHPLDALRGGVTTHSFKKNAFPLDKSCGSLSLLLALKQIFQNKKQVITVTIIIAAVTMASAVGVTLNYTMNANREAFLHSMFDEVAMVDAAFLLKDGNDGEAFQKSLMEYPEVRKVLAYQASGVSLIVDEVNINAWVAKDFAELESQMLVEGYYPKHDNEIALGLLVLNASDKKIGDTVTLRIGDRKSDFIVTGVIQSINGNGFFGLLTTEGVRVVSPDFTHTDFLVYLREGTEAKTFIKRVQTNEGNIFETTMNMQDQIGVTIDSMGATFAAAAYGIITVTAVVVLLTLYMIIKTTILRRRRDLGIQKAVGFTTFQLMNQIALNMTPVILLGVAIGAVAGYFGFNPLLKAMLSGNGIAKVELAVPLDQIIMVCAALVILAYAVSLLISWRIRKINAYAMISE